MYKFCIIFNFDFSRNHPCHSSYPRNTQCVFDNTFDFFTGKMKPHYSLLRGHVVKRIVEDIPVPGKTQSGLTVEGLASFRRHLF